MKETPQLVPPSPDSSQHLNYMEVYSQLDKMTPKFIWKYKGSRIAKTILKNNIGGLILPDFKLTITL